MKSVGIMTTVYGNNFGEALQAFAMRKSINTYCPDHQAELIGFKCFNQKSLTKPGFEGYEELLELKQSKFEEFRRNEIGLTVNSVNSITKENAPDFDQFVFGSDQIWNTQAWKIPEFFGSFVPDNKRKIAYAASVGLNPANPNLDSTLFKEYLDSFYAVSVREKIHCDYVQQFTSKPVRHVADPTMLLDVSVYNDLIKLANPKKPTNNYVFYYQPHSADGAIVSLVNKIARTQKWDVVHTFAHIPNCMFPYESVSARFDGPREFLSYIQGASLVITRSYHAAVFSILFHKPFYVYVDKKTGSRFESLLCTLGLEDRLVYDYLKLEDINFTIDYDSVQKKLDSFKADSIGFLREALN